MSVDRRAPGAKNKFIETRPSALIANRKVVLVILKSRNNVDLKIIINSFIHSLFAFAAVIVMFYVVIIQLYYIFVSYLLTNCYVLKDCECPFIFTFHVKLCISVVL